MRGNVYSKIIEISIGITMKVLIVVLAIFMLSIIGCSNDDEAKYAEGTDAFRSDDYETALAILTSLAEDGHAEAQIFLGSMYDLGEGVPQNYETAAKWWHLAAEDGHAEAQIFLGSMYDLGEGVPQNYETAVKWYTLAAEQGHAEAQYSLGFMYDMGEGVPQNDKTAVKWYTLAAEQNHSEAQYSLGFMYGMGEGVPQNKIYAHMWYNIATSKGLDSLYRDEIEEYMTAAEIITADQLAVECIAKEYKGCMSVY